MQKNKGRRLDALTSLRFVAAAAVVVLHLHGRYGVPEDPALGGRLPLIQGVSFFFVLSGFVLAYAYPRLETWSDRGRFLWARFARLWPAHLFAGAVTLVILGITPGTIAEKGKIGPWVANLTMTHSWLPVFDYYSSAWVGNTASWSIATEFWFYLAFIPLIPLLNRYWPLLVGVALGLALWLVVVASLAGLPYDAPTGLTTNGLLYRFPPARAFEFVVGMAAARLFRAIPPVRPHPAVGTLIELAAVAVAAGMATAAGQATHRLMEATGLAWPTAVWFSAGGLSCPGYALLIVTMGLRLGWVSRTLEWWGFVLLGEVSYSVYLLHLPLVQYLDTYPRTLAGLSHLQTLAAYAGILLVASYLSWSLVECPARRALLRAWPRPVSTGRPAPAVAPVRRGWVRRLVPSLPSAGKVAALFVALTAFGGVV